VTLFRGRRASSRAGRSARAQYRAQRRKILRQNWRDWLAILGIGVGSLAAILLTKGIAQLFFAGLLGATVMVGVFGWLIGDVYSLPWMWGSIGERQTADVLQRLDGSW
jgi:hypothetical protein